MKLNLDQPTEDAQIQIIPLIDVIFCILTFFILASLQMTRQQAINVDLPQAATGQVQMREMLVVTIDNVGQTYIDKQPIDPASLYDRLKQYHDNKPEGLLVLNASQSAYYNDVIRVLDILRKVGGDKVALATIPEGNNPNTPGSPVPGMPGTTFPGAPLQTCPAVCLVQTCPAVCLVQTCPDQTCPVQTCPAVCPVPICLAAAFPTAAPPPAVPYPTAATQAIPSIPPTQAPIRSIPTNPAPNLTPPLPLTQINPTSANIFL
jgi:biopolymer transport protein ExbD